MDETVPTLHHRDISTAVHRSDPYIAFSNDGPTSRPHSNSNPDSKRRALFPNYTYDTNGSPAQGQTQESSARDRPIEVLTGHLAYEGSSTLSFPLLPAGLAESEFAQSGAAMNQPTLTEEGQANAQPTDHNEHDRHVYTSLSTAAAEEGAVKTKNVEEEDNQSPSSHKQSQLVASFSQGWQYTWSDRVLLRVMLVYALINFLNGAVLVLIPLLGLESANRHGFDMSVQEVGNVLLIFAGWATVFQLFLFKPLVRRTTLKTANNVGCWLMALSNLLISAPGYIDNKAGFWTLLVVSMWIMSSGFMLCSSLLNTMIANRAPSTQQGSIQGVSRALASLARAVGPFACGTLFSAVVQEPIRAPIISFAVVGFGYAICAITMMPLEASQLEKQIMNSQSVLVGHPTEGDVSQSEDEA